MSTIIDSKDDDNNDIENETRVWVYLIILLFRHFLLSILLFSLIGTRGAKEKTTTLLLATTGSFKDNIFDCG